MYTYDFKYTIQKSLTMESSADLYNYQQSNIVNWCKERMFLKAVIRALLCSIVRRFLPIFAYSFDNAIPFVLVKRAQNLVYGV